MPQTQAQEDFDLKQWLSEIKAEGGLPDEQIGELEKILGTDKGKAALRKTVSYQRDYTKKTMEAAELRKQAEAELAQMEQERQQLSQWRDGVQSQLDDAYKQYQDSNISAARYQAIIKSLASRYGMDEKELLGGELPADAQPTKGTPVKDIDTSKFLTAEHLDKRFGELKTMDALVQAELIDLSTEHQELFGKPLKGARELVTEALKGNRSIRDLWQEKHGVQAKRDEVKEAQIRADERQKADAEWRAKHSEDAVAGTQSFMPNLPKSVAYETLMKKDAPGPPKPNGSDRSMERVNRAVAAFEDVVSGKG